MNPISAATDAELEQQGIAEDARRRWIASLQAGDEVDVAYSHLPAGIRRMTVIRNDGAKLSLAEAGQQNHPDHWITACAVNGWLLPQMFHLLVPPGATAPFMPHALLARPSR